MHLPPTPCLSGASPILILNLILILILIPIRVPCFASPPRNSPAFSPSIFIDHQRSPSRSPFTLPPRRLLSSFYSAPGQAGRLSLNLSLPSSFLCPSERSLASQLASKQAQWARSVMFTTRYSSSALGRLPTRVSALLVRAFTRSCIMTLTSTRPALLPPINRSQSVVSTRSSRPRLPSPTRSMATATASLARFLTRQRPWRLRLSSPKSQRSRRPWTA